MLLATNIPHSPRLSPSTCSLKGQRRSRLKRTNFQRRQRLFRNLRRRIKPSNWMTTKSSLKTFPLRKRKNHRCLMFQKPRKSPSTSGSTPTPSHPSGPGKFWGLTFGNLHYSCISSDPKDVTDAEYLDFYRATFKDYRPPIGWHQFGGDAAGSSFKGIIFLPEKMFVLSVLS